jgi:RNA polymerase sigma-70 factor, ECF subfamily
MQRRSFPFRAVRGSIVGVSSQPIVTSMPGADERTFAAVVERHRTELHRHCARLLPTGPDAEDALQETLLRAWRSRHTLASDSPRAWLYRIATNACHDVLRRRGPALASLNDETAFADGGPLEAAAPAEERPDAIAVRRDSLERALLTAVQELPPRQHASLVMRDVLDWPAEDTATALSTSVAATNSALQRARRGLRQRLAKGGPEWACAAPSASQRRTVRRYLSALEAPCASTTARLLEAACE